MRQPEENSCFLPDGQAGLAAVSFEDQAPRDRRGVVMWSQDDPEEPLRHVEETGE
jgi:hypothetical protein